MTTEIMTRDAVEAPDAERVRRWMRVALATAGLLTVYALLVVYRFAVTIGAYRNSDDGANFLAGLEMAEGNWRLHGWTLAPDNYATTEVLLQAMLKLLFGSHPLFMQGAEALVWAAIAVVGTALACWGARTRHLPGIMALALAMLAFNVFEHRFRDVTISNVGSHGSTILLSLMAFAVCVVARLPPATRAAGLFMVIVTGSFADPIFIVVACLPILALSLFHLRDRPRPAALAIGITVGGVALARGLLALNIATGGFHALKMDLSLASPGQLASNFGFAAAAVARLLGAEFFGRDIHRWLPDGPAIFLLRAPLAAAFAIVCGQAGREVFARVVAWPRNKAGAGQDLDHLLWISLFLGVLSACMSNKIVDQSCVRFFLPVTVMGSILVARRFGRLPLVALYGGAILLASMVVGSLTISPGRPGAQIAIPQLEQIVGVLRENGLTQGYAGYWEAAIVTALANRQITSLPVQEFADGKLHAAGYFANLDWFADSARHRNGRTFFITVHQPSWLEVPEATVIRQFGPPAQQIDLGQFVIDIYDFRHNEPRQLAPGVAAAY